MKNILNKVPKLLLLLIGVGMIASVYPYIVNADISNPHPTPPVNTVTTAMIQNAAITPEKVSSTGSFTVGSITSTNSTSTNATTTMLAVTGPNMSLNGVNYSWPSSDGTSGQVLTTSGSKSLSFTTPPNNYLVSSLYSATTTSVSSPVAVYQISTLNYINSISYEGSNTAYTPGALVSQSVSYTVTRANHTGLYLTCTINDPTAPTITAVIDGVSVSKIAYLPHNTYDRESSVFYEGNVSVGSHTGTCTGSSSTNVFLATITAYEGIAVDQSLSATTTAQSNGVTITTTINGSWVGLSAYDIVSGQIGASTNTRVIYSVSNNSTAVLDNNGPVSSAGAYNVAWGGISPSYPETIAYEIAPYTPTFSFYGFNYTNAATTATSDGFVGFISASPTYGVKSTVTTEGYLSGFSGLSVGSKYYLSNTLGAISTTAGTVSHTIGVAVSPTELLIHP